MGTSEQKVVKDALDPTQAHTSTTSTQIESSSIKYSSAV